MEICRGVEVPLRRHQDRVDCFRVAVTQALSGNNAAFGNTNFAEATLRKAGF
jgi:hypothetical protein